MSRLHGVLALMLVVASGGCAGATSPGARSVGDAERMRAGLDGKDTASLAPQPFAAATHELELAKQAQSAHDDSSAELHAEHAVSLYNQAIAVARLARATLEKGAAGEALARANALAGRYAAQRQAVDREADDLEKKLRVAREAQLPPSSGPVDPDRARARVVAAQSLVAQARLLCSAARLVSAQAPGLSDAETAVVTLEKPMDGSRAATSIDAAARVRAACLTSLTRARRSSGADADQPDTLLSELSQSGDPKAVRRIGDLAPARDERGVVVTMRSAFAGDKLTPEAEAKLLDLGRVAAAHAAFAVQVVLHDATAPSAGEILANQKRGQAVMQTLVAGGAAAAKVKVEQAGAKAPIVDPKDAAHRDRNARLEIVFVAVL